VNIDEFDVELFNYLNSVFSGEVLNDWTAKFISFFKILNKNSYVIKFCRANLMLNWILKIFLIKKSILLIRHPLAVISSQLKHGVWKNVKPPYIFQDEFKKNFPKIVENLKGVNEQEEILAVNWAIETLIPLLNPKPYPFILTSYEKLVLEKAKELKRILLLLDINTVKDLQLLLNRPSKTTRENSNVFIGDNLLCTWKKYLSKKQIKNILNVINKVGIDFYDIDLEPDYQRMNNFTINFNYV